MGHRERMLKRCGGLDETEGVWALLCVAEHPMRSILWNILCSNPE